MRTKLSETICICLLAAFVFYGLSSCHKNKNENPQPRVSVPVPTDKWTHLNTANWNVSAVEVVNNTIYAGSGNTLYISKDEGATWKSVKVAAPGAADITAIKVFNNCIYIGSAGGNGIFSSNDGGVNWENSNASLFENSVSSFAELNNKLYAASDGDGVFVLNQSSNKWESFSYNLPRPFTSYHVFKITRIDNTLVAAAGVNSTFYRYSFDARQWIESSLPKHGTYILDMVVDNGAIIGIGTEGKILRSENLGMDWIYDALDLLSSISMVISNEKLYTGSLNYYVLINTVNGGWTQQRDKAAPVGSSWAIKNDFLSKILLNGIAELNGKLFLATDHGFYIRKL
ncbi:sialidase family protein [Mucilaginibacter sp. L3T2-6]|uniref:sialidase family protein n=1 Tax=Mucilaginibacter sp. L3T2-6 TaxID=3062491 RepID=UPI002676710F|nr:sialidase family protein [Mucilaginibacter sp. L3T2-6]MDO3643602.1 sialidase family protein [Mucilaginibacter sp. L3T2-6]MDV6216150.1 sialidase family protein [Mucilaginibacter sp. L3T2-6]